MRRRTMLSGIAALGATAFAAGCGADSDDAKAGAGDAPAPKKTSAEVPEKPESGTFTMGILPWIGFGLWYVAEEKGYPAEHGIDEYKLTRATKDSDLIAALAAGKIDAAPMSSHYVPLLMEQNSDMDLKILSVLDVSTTADAILASPEVGGISGLKGKRVAFEEGATSEVMLRYALKEKGLTIDDITKVPMPASDAGAALIGKKVDAAVTYEPYVSAAKADDKKISAIYTAGNKEGLIADVLAVRAEVLDKRPGQLLAMLKSWDDAYREYKKDTEGSRAIIAKAVGSKPEELKTAFDGIRYYSAEENASYLPGPYRVGVLRDVVDVCTEAEILKKKWSHEAQDALIVDSFVKAL